MARAPRHQNILEAEMVTTVYMSNFKACTTHLHREDRCRLRFICCFHVFARLVIRVYGEVCLSSDKNIKNIDTFANG